MINISYSLCHELRAIALAHAGTRHYQLSQAIDRLHALIFTSDIFFVYFYTSHTYSASLSV